MLFTKYILTFAKINVVSNHFQTLLQKEFQRKRKQVYLVHLIARQLTKLAPYNDDARAQRTGQVKQ